MAVELTVRGQRKLDTVADRLAREARVFQRRVSTATKDAVQRNYRPVLVGMTASFMPNRYAAVLSRDLRVATTVSLASGRVTVRVSAPTGGKTGRQVDSLEFRGQLRHPLFGNRKHWYGQRIRRRFASVPLHATKRYIVMEIDRELDKISRNVERG